MKNVTIYTTPTCAYCKMAKKYFQENDIKYKEIDASSEPGAAEEMMKKSGQMGVPVIIVGEGSDEEVIIGFDKPKLAGALEISG